ncbi:MAG: hypothetical protein LBC59_04945 [Chitinispirillales bacterium]|jgi:hypothetical protein|nr:hypothetical protein [Chitinispirillales bacterium]
MKRTIAIIFLTLCPLLLTCGDDCTYKIKYEVTGLASVGGVSLSIVNEYGDDEAFSGIRLPWVKDFEIQFRDDRYYGGKFVSGIFPAYVAATLNVNGSVAVKIYYSGELVSCDSASGRYETAEARYGVRLR